MEKISKFSKHKADTYARLIREALQSRLAYSSYKDYAIMLCAQNMEMYQDVSRKIKSEGTLLVEKSREGNNRYIKNPLIDFTIKLSSEITSELQKLGYYADPKTKDDDDDEMPIAEDEVPQTEDPILDITEKMAKIKKMIFKKNA